MFELVKEATIYLFPKDLTNLVHNVNLKSLVCHFYLINSKAV